MVACIAWRFWLGALNKKDGRGQRNGEEIGAGASPLFRARFRSVVLPTKPLCYAG